MSLDLAQRRTPWKRLGNVWEDWLRVTIANDDWHQKDVTMSCALSIVVEPFKRGVDPSSGKVYMLCSSGTWAIPLDPQAERQKKAKLLASAEGPGGIRLEEKAEVSYVPATPENIAALQDVAQRVVNLRQRLVSAFMQDSILKTLGSLNSVLALVAPEESDGPTAPRRTGPR